MRTFDGQAVPNLATADPDYPTGRVKDSTTGTAKDGTKATEISNMGMGDIYQGVQNILTAAGVTPNENPESVSNQQLKEAFDALYAAKSVVPVSVITFKWSSTNIVAKNTVGEALTYVVTPKSYVSSDAGMSFELLISTAGDYVVTLSPATEAPAAGGAEFPISYIAAHAFATGLFINSSGTDNIICQMNGSGNTVTESDLKDQIGFVATIYRV